MEGIEEEEEKRKIERKNNRSNKWCNGQERKRREKWEGREFIIVSN